MLYLENDFSEISERIKVVNGKMTEGALNPDFLKSDLSHIKWEALKQVSENQFLGSIVTIRSRCGTFPTRYKYKIHGVKATFKYTKKGWLYQGCERTEHFPKQRIPEWTIVWSKSARESLEKKAEKAYSDMLQRAKFIDG